MKRQAEQNLDQQTTPADKLVALAESLGCPETALDDMVHDLASQMASDENNANDDDDLDDERHDLASKNASDINNRGVSAQVAWLLENGASADDVEAELRASVLPEPAMEPRV